MRWVRTFSLLAALAMVLAVGALASANMAHAQALPPRPDVPAGAPDTGNGSSRNLKPGRITGTIINSATGAPTPGVTVYVGGSPVTSDANGNYVRDGLMPGSYAVLIWLYPRMAVSDQDAAVVQVWENQTVVQHLYFHDVPKP